MRPVRAGVAAAALTLVALASGIGVALATSEDEETGQSATAVLHDATGQRVGTVALKQNEGKTSVRAAVSRLAPGFHGLHVHSVGECVPPFTSAGGHFNPTGAAHGDHAGDLPSLLVMEDGTARLRFPTDRFSLDDLFDADGSALIVHAGRDNYANIPDRYHSHTEDVMGPDSATLATGDAGDRAACGVVERSDEQEDED
jgi:superoxide dismutase, Cu-Zn family